MVKKGDFTVELIDAATKKPFKEHTAPDGEIYIEVEPEVEYFIRVKNPSGRKIMYTLKVDGECLAYQGISLSRNDINDCGVWSRCNGVSSMTALKLSKADVKNTGSDTYYVPSLWTGQVTINIYNALFSHMVDQSDFVADFKKGDVGYVKGVSDKTQSKGVQSAKGTVKESKNESNRINSYKEGGLIETFKLNYCTAPGLINAGILPKPPVWEYARMAKQSKRRAPEGGKEPNIQPKKIRIEGVEGIIRAREYEVYDLSQLSDTENDGAFSQDTI